MCIRDRLSVASLLAVSSVGVSVTFAEAHTCMNSTRCSAVCKPIAASDAPIDPTPSSNALDDNDDDDVIDDACACTVVRE